MVAKKNFLKAKKASVMRISFLLSCCSFQFRIFGYSSLWGDLGGGYVR